MLGGVRHWTAPLASHCVAACRKLCKPGPAVSVVLAYPAHLTEAAPSRQRHYEPKPLLPC